MIPKLLLTLFLTKTLPFAGAIEKCENDPYLAVYNFQKTSMVPLKYLHNGVKDTGWTPFMILVVTAGDDAIYERFVSCLCSNTTVDVNQRTKKGYTAFMLAVLSSGVHKNGEKVVEMLLQTRSQTKLDLNAMTNNGETVLALALKYNHMVGPNVLLWLFSHGAVLPEQQPIWALLGYIPDHELVDTVILYLNHDTRDYADQYADYMNNLSTIVFSPVISEARKLQLFSVFDSYFPMKQSYFQNLTQSLGTQLSDAVRLKLLSLLSLPGTTSECAICFSEFGLDSSKEQVVPVILKCGHFFCRFCCDDILKVKNQQSSTILGSHKKIECPTCRAQSRF